MSYQKQIDLYKGYRVGVSTLFILLRYSLIGINAIFIILSLSLDVLSASVNNFIKFWNINFVSASQTFADNFFQSLDSVFIYFFIFAIYLLYTVFLIFHKFFVRKKLTIPFTKYEFLFMVHFYLFGILFILLSFLGIGYFHIDQGTWKSVLTYIIPLIDFAVFISLISFNVICFIQHIWNINKNFAKINKANEQSIVQISILTQVLLFINIVLISALWSVPLEGIINAIISIFNFKNNPRYIFTYIMSFIIFIYIIASTIFILLRIAKRVSLEKRKKIQTLPLIEILINTYLLIIIAIFILSTSVSEMWYRADKNHIIFLTIGVINTILTMPAIALIFIYHSYNSYRLSHEVKI